MVQRVEVYCKDGKLCIMEYSSVIENGVKKEVHSGYLDGEEAEKYISNLSNNLTISQHINLNDWCEYTRYNDGRIIQLYNPENIKEHGYLKDYFEQLSKYEKAKKKNLASKVTRKNKYSGKKIAATGLVLLSLIFVTIYGNSIKVNDYDNTYHPEISIEATNPTTIKDALEDLWTEPTINKPSLNIKPTYSEFTPEASSPQFVPETTYPEYEEDEYLEDNNYLYIEYDDRSNNEKTLKTRNLYGNIIEKYATMYGLDADLVIALATQERGVHSSQMDRGGATGLMQIQNSVWVGNSITAYNFETGKRETIKVTEDLIADCEMNIKIGCMILQEMMRSNNYNILMGLQSYNMGTGGVSIAVRAYAESIGCTRQEIVNEFNDCEWINYRHLVKWGDQKYIEHVLSYMGSDANIEIYKPDGTKVVCNVRNYEKTKSR